MKLVYTGKIKLKMKLVEYLLTEFH